MPADERAQRTSERAARVFSFEQRPAESPLVERIWRTVSEPAESFLSVASTHWLMVITRQRDQMYLTVRGPETRTSLSGIPDNAEFIGVVFRHGTLMPSFEIRSLVDNPLTLPSASNNSFWLDGCAWQYPDFDNADTFVDRLVRRRMLVHDPLVSDVLRGEAIAHRSVRTVERRVLRATGLRRGLIRQIERADQAVRLLDSGVAILDTVARLGYADQAHLARSLRRFVGQTPSEILAAAECRFRSRRPG